MASSECSCSGCIWDIVSLRLSQNSWWILRRWNCANILHGFSKLCVRMQTLISRMDAGQWGKKHNPDILFSRETFDCGCFPPEQSCRMSTPSRWLSQPWRCNNKAIDAYLKSKIALSGSVLSSHACTWHKLHQPDDVSESGIPWKSHYHFFGDF